MRIMYFGENKEAGTERVAVIRFTDDEFELYKYIENYEHTYGDVKRKFASGGLIGIERNEKGVWINESYISVDDFTDFNEFKANYKEAKKEFKTLKKLSTETEPETVTEIETAEETAKKTEIAINMVKYGIPKTKFLPTEIFDTKVECDNMEKILNFDKFAKALIKSVGIEKAKEVTYTVQGVNVFFEFNGSMYKCYTPQSKLYKLLGQRFNLITWKDLKKENDEKSDDKSDGVYTARSPPESFLLSMSRKIN